MDLGGEDTGAAEMGPSDRKSETSRLVAPNIETSPSYLNILSNICGLVFLGIIMYCCFIDGVTLFSFHPMLMTLGWMLFMTSAMHALTPGDLATGWMPIRLKSARHWILQLSWKIWIDIIHFPFGDHVGRFRSSKQFETKKLPAPNIHEINPYICWSTDILFGGNYDFAGFLL
ncbi:hypothetical protein HF086_004486 [Spodoptera exigua]|uniref:Uncharacterized protein n=1 Tax=Spodoptera exigua TaxID=7107 RepID=A0A922M5L1_SPOEX|nr:hypothetical protein HF086_004486 [Spodoptera exigua]